MSVVVRVPYTAADLVRTYDFRKPVNIFKPAALKAILSTAGKETDAKIIVRNFIAKSGPIAKAEKDALDALRIIAGYVIVTTDATAQLASIYNQDQYGPKLGQMIKIEALTKSQFQSIAFQIVRYDPGSFTESPPPLVRFQATSFAMTKDLIVAYAALDDRHLYYLYDAITKAYTDQLVDELAAYKGVKPEPTSRFIPGVTGVTDEFATRIPGFPREFAGDSKDTPLAVDESEDTAPLDVVDQTKQTANQLFQQLQQGREEREQAAREIALLRSQLATEAPLAQQLVTAATAERNRQETFELSRQLSQAAIDNKELRERVVAQEGQLVLASDFKRLNDAAEKTIRTYQAQIEAQQKQIQLYQERSGELQRYAQAAADQKGILDYINNQNAVVLDFDVKQNILRTVQALVDYVRRNKILLESADKKANAAIEEAKQQKQLVFDNDRSRQSSEAALQAQIKKLTDDIASVRSDLITAEGKEAAARTAVREAEAKLSIAQSEVKIAQGETKTARESETAVKRQLDDLEIANGQLQAQLAAAKTVTNTDSSALDAAKTALKASQERETKALDQVRKTEEKLADLTKEEEKAQATLRELNNAITVIIETDVRGIPGDSKLLPDPDPIKNIRGAFERARSLVDAANKRAETAETTATAERSSADQVIDRTKVDLKVAREDAKNAKDKLALLTDELEELKKITPAVPGASAASIKALVSSVVNAPAESRRGQLLIKAPDEDSPQEDVVVYSAVAIMKSMQPVKSRGQTPVTAEGFADLQEICTDQVMSLAIIDMLTNTFDGFYNPLASLYSQLATLMSTPPVEQHEFAACLFVADLLLVFNMLNRRPNRVTQLQILRSALLLNQSPVSYVPLIVNTIRRSKNAYVTAMTRRSETNVKSNAFWWITDLDSALTLKAQLEGGNRLARLNAELRNILTRDSSTTFQLSYAMLSNSGKSINLFRLMCGVLWRSDDMTLSFRSLLYANGGAVLIYQILNSASLDTSGNDDLKRMFARLKEAYGRDTPQLQFSDNGDQKSITMLGSKDVIASPRYTEELEFRQDKPQESKRR
jgi:hypothetical protein